MQDFEMDILFSNKALFVGEVRIPVFVRNHESVPMAKSVVGRVSGDILIPALRSKFVKVLAQPTKNSGVGETMIVELRKNYADDTRVMVTCATNIVGEGGIIHVNVGNLCEKPIKLIDSEPLVKMVDGTLDEIIVTEQKATKAQSNYLAMHQQT